MPGTFRSSGPCPIEFPATCEVRVNNSPLIANLKGVKKKPGTAPPADVTNLVRKAQGVGNALEMIYINSQPNTAPKVLACDSIAEVIRINDLIEILPCSQPCGNNERGPVGETITEQAQIAPRHKGTE